MQQSLKQFRYFLIFYIIFFIIVFSLYLIYSKSDLFLFINSKHNAFFDIIFSATTNVGDGLSFGIVLLIAFFKVSKKDFYFGLAIFGFTSLVSTIFKRVLFYNELRPSAWFPDAKVIHFVEGVKVYAHHSFPSGHTITAFALAFYGTYLCKDKRYGILFLLIAILVGYSRIYLGQHFFEDVLFGSLISVFTSILCLVVFEKYIFANNPRKLNPTEADTGL